MPDEVFERWIRRFHPAPEARVRLVCLPHAGGGGFFSLSAALAPSIEVWSVKYPGRQDRRHEPLIPDIGRLAAELAGVLDGRLEGPWALLGHSMGAVVAFETARLLPGALCLIASGRRAPSTHRDERVHLRDDQGIADELRLLSGTDPAFIGEPELFQMILPVLRADYRAVETYEAGREAVVDCPITAFVGDDDPKTTIEEARAWRRHTSATFGLRIFPGGHFFLDDRRAEVAAALSGILLDRPVKRP
ncbi:thioesterase II family protein [Nonomuraea cavernae]|uniref:Oleoyl-ACP hydrolase n=1 Tax=Nonomuraea cavernae TaxID=2045107 RepID=A0A918DE99_9ACTN|nr:alpha/beta fold hydrolase [Nonomuraea cavernae]MCA2183586.1 alpha/beta fold hydrolase [Nonomuraea cavernae]GGO60748.1 oleoyl-ACP hydrolase [Nonomuraea cavernae]